MIRPLREEDAEFAASLVARHWPDPPSVGALLHMWSGPTIELEQDGRRTDDAFAVAADDGADRAFLWLFGDPDDELLEWVEARAFQKAPRLLSGAWATDATVLRALERRGFRHVRTNYRMARDLAPDEPRARWPEGVTVRTYRPEDERTYYDLYLETFRDHWEPPDQTVEEWRHELVGDGQFRPELWFLAEEGGEPAGFAICKPHSSDPTIGVVWLLGVRRAQRKRGLGRALLQHAFAELAGAGMTQVVLGVDAESETGAARLYEGAGMRAGARFELYEKRR